WGTVPPKHWIPTGARSRTDAIDFAYNYFTVDQPPGSVPSGLNSTTQVGQYIRSPRSGLNTKTWPFVNTVLDGIGGSIDVLNFHYYQSPRYIGTVTDWLRGRTARAGYSVPLLTNEMSLRSQADQCNPAAPFS